MIQALRRFKAVNEGLVAIIVIAVLSFYYMIDTLDLTTRGITVELWLKVGLTITAIIWALIKRKTGIAALILFLLGYSSTLGLFINQILTFNIPDYWEFVKLFISAVAALYLILLMLSYLVTESFNIDKNVSNETLLLTVISVLFIYVAYPSFGNTLIVFSPIIVALLGGISLSAVLLITAVTLDFPIRIIDMSVNGMWSNQWHSLAILVLGTLLFVFSLYVLVREIKKVV